MSKKEHISHPYHYSVDKNIIQWLIDWGVVVGLFLLYFNFYNFGRFTPSEMVKTTGLMAISLLSLTLLTGPVARFLPFLDLLKAHRRFWGIASFLFAALHLILVLVFYFKLNIFRLFDSVNPKFLGLEVGLWSAAVLLLVALTSHQKALRKLNPKVWKAIQLTSYIALIFAVVHFYLMEQVNGVLVIKRSLGQITFWFAVAVIIIRLIVLFFPKKRRE